MTQIKHELGKILFMIFSAIMIASIAFATPSYAAKTILSPQTYYHLDMGIQLAYEGSNWADRGYNLGQTITPTSTVSFGQDVEVQDAYPFDGSNFPFDDQNATHNIPKILGEGGSAYAQYYKNYVSNLIRKNGNPSANGKSITFSYSAKLSTTEPLEVVSYGINSNDDEIWKLFGGKNNVSNANVKAAIENALLQGANGTAGDNRLYLIFCPTVIEYKKYITVGDLEADLSLPSSAAQNETFTVSDATYVDQSLTLETADIDFRIDGGMWQDLVIWQGTGASGVNTGKSTSQSFSDICTVDYRIIATTTTGQTSEKIRSISITDGMVVDATAILELPTFTYEGHPVEAVDVSEFKVDGTTYSAKRAYEEGIASNSFATVPTSAGKTSRLTNTAAEMTFYKRGDYNGKLTVKTKDNKTLTDTKPIEVRKTPYILDYLGGFQKQNRKQVLNISVATYPDQPITDYYITLKDLKTGESISLTKDKPQGNTAAIKTRAHTTEGDQYWTNFTLEFLTKTPDYDANNPDKTQDFQYTVYVKDKKGDTDQVTKIFTVKPDIPPQPNIAIQDSFIRNQGTNIAEIIMEDGTVTDGDQLARTWSLVDTDGNVTDVMNLQGYTDLSFGSKQQVQFNKEGVGKVKVGLFVKDVWNEPTLPEYITEADYLTGESTAITEVINIAPTVRLESLRMLEVDLAIVANRSEMAGIEAQRNTLQASLLEKGIDASIQMIPAADANENGYQFLGSKTWPVSINCGCCQATGVVFDSSHYYRIESIGRTVSGYQEVCTAPHTIYAMEARSGSGGVATLETAWSYTVNESSDFNLYIDSSEKYAYIRCRDTGKTIILSRNSGAYITMIDVLLPDAEPYLSNDGKRLYFLTANGIQKYDLNSGKLSAIISKSGSLARLQGGKITFVGQEGAYDFSTYQFDMNTEKLTAQALPRLPEIEGNYVKGSVTPSDMDQSGKVSFTQTAKSYSDIVRFAIWCADANTGAVSSHTISGNELRDISVGFVKDETGNGLYLYEFWGNMPPSSSNSIYHYLDIYELTAGGAIGSKHSLYNNKDNRSNSTSVSYAKYHSKENAIYLMQGADYGFNGLIQGMQCKVQLPSWSISSTQSQWSWDSAEEYGTWKEDRMLTYHNTESWTGMTHRVKVFSNSITDGQASVLGLLEKADFRKDAKKYIVNLKGVDDLTEALATKLNASVFNLNDLSNAADAIDEKNADPVSVIKLEGDGGSNLAAFYKVLSLEKNTRYQYSYDLMITGAAIDLFQPSIGQSNINFSKDTVYEEISYVKDFTVQGTDSGFFQTGKTSHGFTGTGFGVEYSGKKGESYTFSCWVDFTMAAAGYTEFDFFYNNGLSKTATYSIAVNGVTYESGVGSATTGTRLMFLEPGDYRILFTGESGSIGITKIKAVYTGMENNTFAPAKVVTETGRAVTVSGSFKTEKQMLYNKDNKVTYPVICETFQNGGPTELKDYMTLTANDANRAPWVFNSTARSVTMSRYNNSSTGTVTINAPADKMAFVSLKESYSCTRSVSGNAKEIETGKYMIPAGGSLEFSYRSLSTGTRVVLSEIKILFLNPNNEYGISEDAIYGDINALIKGTTLSQGQPDWVGFDANASLSGQAAFAFEKYTNIGQGSETINKVGFSTAGTGGMIEALISNFELFSTGGIGINKSYGSDAFNSLKLLQDNGWQIETMGRGNVTEALMEPPEIDETAPLIYKKGELVKYNIFYEDYEDDPSKQQYWRYTHTPFNDGAHPEAAFILDEDGNVVTSKGTILPASIDRFYIDGKYTARHWQEDDTSRGKVLGGNPDYDKLSNVESITFYIEGGAAAPWITHISTVPVAVKEGEDFKIKVGVDDLEKDILSLTTEVYLDRTLIYTHRQKDIVADTQGNYPYIYTDILPDKAKAGTYEVVCTVRDQMGAGIGSYKFIVVSEGSIVGTVTHTEDWETKRQTYNATHANTRGSNVFWPGERFVLSADVGGMATKVTAQILQTDYLTTMTNTGKTRADGQAIYAGSLWDNSMLSKWKDAEGIEAVFRFTAYYAGGKTKTHDVKVILDNRDGSVLIHRVW